MVRSLLFCLSSYFCVALIFRGKSMVSPIPYPVLCHSASALGHQILDFVSVFVAFCAPLSLPLFFFFLVFLSFCAILGPPAGRTLVGLLGLFYVALFLCPLNTSRVVLNESLYSGKKRHFVCLFVCLFFSFRGRFFMEKNETLPYTAEKKL